jgi:hypothetical protein
LAVSSVCYWSYATSADNGPSGGSWQGLVFGVLASLLMIIAGLLALRKKVPRWRIGSAQAWLRAHIWLGLLSVPMVLFHAGFRWGGLLEQVLLAVLALVILSGVVGLIFQHYLPRVIKVSTPREAMFEQVPAVCNSLRTAAEKKILPVCGSLFEPSGEADPGATYDDARVLREFYVTAVRPFLSAEPNADSPLHSPARASAIFQQVRRTLSKPLHPVLSELDSLCSERRQLAAQVRLHRWLHLWLFVHIPLSLSLLVLGIVHAVVSVYY